MKAAELRAKTVEELHALLSEVRAEQLTNLRALAANELPNPRVVTKGRRTVARIHTILKEKLTAASSPSSDKPKEGKA